MKTNKKANDGNIDLVYRVLKQLLLRLEAKELEYARKEQYFPSKDCKETTWLLGFTPAENRRLNWILNYRYSEIKNNSNIN